MNRSILVFVVMFAAEVFAGGTWYVDCEKGDDANSGAFGSPKATIRAATTNAASGDVIYVAPGTYGAAEGTQAATSEVGARVVIPEGVTLESTDGAENTFIIGAAATGEGIDNATYGTGVDAVRCVYAESGSVLRGFTLAGGRTVGTGDDSYNGNGSAFYSHYDREAAIEDCIVSNNVAYRGTIYQSVARRCRIFDNIGLNNQQSGSAGYKSSLYGCIADRNGGGGTVSYSYDIVNCTFGTSNSNLNNAANFPAVYSSETRSIVNTSILGGGINGGGTTLFLTNCVVVANWMWNNRVPEANKVKCSWPANAAATGIDSDYRPQKGSMVIDAGNNALAAWKPGDRDVYGTPRVRNGVIDIGAVEYDGNRGFILLFR